MRAKIVFGTIIGICLIALSAAGVGKYVRSARAIHPKSGEAVTLPGQDGKTTLLFNGWRISPAGRHVQTGDMPLGGAISPDGTTLAITNSGYNAHALHLIELATEKEIAKIPLVRTWNGIAWSPRGDRIYVAGGISNPQYDVYVIERRESQWENRPGYLLQGNDKQKTCVAGLALTAGGRYLLALNNSDDHLYVIDTTSGDTVSRTKVGDHPLTVRMGRQDRAYVSNLGGSEIAVLDISDVRAPRILHRWATGQHPNDIAVGTDGRIFVSCGNSDEVTVIDSESGRSLESVKTGLTPKAPSGSTPNALALTPDQKTLYVANADNNNVCVIDVSKKGRSRVTGFIPTGWYPTSVHTTPDGKRLIIGSGKGMGTGPNPVTLPIGKEYAGGFSHMGRLLTGFLSFVESPSESKLKTYTEQCFFNSPYRDSQLKASASSRKTAIPTKIGGRTPIKYVLYIIKENRTYDQVFGALPRGNGDPRLVLFGREVTPNHHALAEQYVLLDNLYCSGEVSADGHPWSTSAYATDFTQRSWVLSYSGKGSTVRGEGVNEPKGGYLWEACAKKGVSYRSYGEYSGHKTLKGNFSEAFMGKVGPNEIVPGRDKDKADIFIKEFKHYERTKSIPRFMIMSLGENHTNGTRPGSYTPKAMVASNDQALGKIVEAISTSSVWKEFAIFVIEDDAQNGPDHVDSHRTIGLAISPYTRRGHLDSTMYTTASMLRTMELILGLPPLSQYDASATPMFNSFTDKADLTSYRNLPPQIDLNAKNPASAYGARESAKMDWSEYDRTDEQALNRILWHSIKGPNVPMPAPVRRALPSASGGLHAAILEE